MRTYIFTLAMLLITSALLLLVATLMTPLAYAQNIGSAALTISSDNTWRYSAKLIPNWEQLNFNDTSWPYAKSPYAGSCALQNVHPSFTTPMWIASKSQFLTLYFRKTITLSGFPKSAKITAAFDDDGDVYVNGMKVISDSSGKVEPNPVEANVSLNQGENIIAIKVRDTHGGCQWVQLTLSVELETGVIINVPLFKQDDARWANHTYASGDQENYSCGKTFADCACALTSISMLLHFYGITSYLPDTLNSYFLKDQKCLHGSCVSLGYVFGDVRWSAINRLTKESHDASGTRKVQYMGTGSDPREEVLAGRPVIAKAINKNHWFVIRGLIGNTFTIRDPLFKNTEATATATFRRFEEVHSDFSQIEAFTQSPQHLVLIDSLGRKTGFSDGKIVEDIPNSTYEFEEFIESTNSAGLWVARVRQPENGNVTISGSGKIAVYVSDMNADEKSILVDDSTVKIEFSHDSVEESVISFSNNQSCSLLTLPLIVRLKNVAGTPRIYEGTAELHGVTATTTLTPISPTQESAPP